MAKRKKNEDVPEKVVPIVWGWRDAPDESGEALPYGNFEQGKMVEPGDQWHEVEWATGSDYSGGLVTKANYEVLQEMLEEKHPSGEGPPVWATTYGGYGTYGVLVVWDRLDGDIQEAIAGLEDYPLIDEEKHSELQIDAEEEAWENWGRSEFESQLENHYDLDDFPEGVDSQQLFGEAAESANQYWEPESGGDVYIDVAKVSKKAIEIIDANPDLSAAFTQAAANPGKRSRKLKSKLLR